MHHHSTWILESMKHLPHLRALLWIGLLPLGADILHRFSFVSNRDKSKHHICYVCIFNMRIREITSWFIVCANAVGIILQNCIRCTVHKISLCENFSLHLLQEYSILLLLERRILVVAEFAEFAVLYFCCHGKIKKISYF